MLRRQLVAPMNATDVLQRLKRADPMRSEYHSDFVSIAALEQALNTGSNTIANLTSRSLRNLPRACWFTGVSVLDLCDNRLTCAALEHTITSLPSLSELRLDRNNIQRLPSDMLHMNALRTLSLRGNMVTDARPLVTLPLLERLDVTECPLEESAVLMCAPMLRELNGRATEVNMQRGRVCA